MGNKFMILGLGILTLSLLLYQNCATIESSPKTTPPETIVGPMQ